METIIKKGATVVAKLPAVQLTGIGLVLFSLFLLLLPEWGFKPSGGSLFGIALMNYALAVLFFFVLLVGGHMKFRSAAFRPEALFLYLVLALISCFSLNREIPVFQDSTQWLDLYLITLGVALAGYTFKSYLPVVARHLLLFWLGAGFLLAVYYALYLAPYYLIGMVGAIGLGLSLHLLVPLQLLVLVVLAVKNAWREDNRYLYSFALGCFVPLVVLVTFLGQWQRRNAEISRLQHEYIIRDNNELPRWVHLSRHLPQDHLTEKLIKTSLVYQVPEGNIGVWDLPSSDLADLKRHDPLVMIAAFLFGNPQLDTNERVKILESLYDARHYTQQRLWSGRTLSTSTVVSQVRLYPQYRLSYTEKVLRIRNSQPGMWNQQEAIYTFYLPEGSVVTSLSLWVNGQEEKAALTTQGKADSAYTTIVGREMRDPSVVHWQEGNTVSVRVFPCTSEEDRQFKLGITTPLREEDGQLVYDNVYFSGPAADGAEETAMVYLEAPVTALDLPFAFEQDKPQQYRYHGDYRHDWQIRFDTPAFSTHAFTWQGHSYQLAPQTSVTEHFDPQRVYLDLNRAWTTEEAAEVWEAVKHKKVYVYDDEMIKLTEENHEALFERLLQQSFSLFPLHHMREPEQALLISKSTENSPNLKDLKDSPFREELGQRLPQGTAIRVFHLGRHLSPYLKTLKELQVLTVNSGTTEKLAQQLRVQQFTRSNTAADAIAMGASDVNIVKTAAAATTPTAAPDHLLRLFAYNHLLQQLGANYFRKDFVEEAYLEEARLANIVSPVSSLIVLEKQADYDRFDIKKSKDSLGNASIKSSGAVPEPEEWALIIVVAILVAFMSLKPYLLRT
ncbi:XrtN system VIT domain-containing protein [Botryobacter ruber]|uniref:XrtN system VIT domain-containing protein n=1 Tax=Botryobacter ruber TaxID=2171629 RepID=UPI000E0C5520|nr:XrtN system VIT domain-containing protein [Botryobacter ruber]